MSVSHLRRAFLAAFALALGLTFAGSARAGDLERFKAREAVAAQKALRDIREQIVEARKLEDKDPAQARSLLKQARNQLDDTKGIGDRDRAVLTQQIRNALTQVEASLRDQENQARVAADRDLRKRVEADRLRELDAQKKLTGPYSKASDMIGLGKDTLATYQKLKMQRESGIVGVTREVYQTNAVMNEQRITERFVRAADRGKPKLTAAEKEMLKMLNSVMKPNWDKTPLKEVIEYIQEKTNLNIFVDENSLKEANIEYDTPVTFKVPTKVTVRTILKKVLADNGLTFILKDAAVHVMTPDKARQYVVARAYPIADLLPTPAGNMPQFINQAQMFQSAQGVMALIVNTVEPASWQVNGGTGTIMFHPPSMSIVIRQTAEFHYQMGGALSR